MLKRELAYLNCEPTMLVETKTAERNVLTNIVLYHNINKKICRNEIFLSLFLNLRINLLVFPGDAILHLPEVWQMPEE